MISQEHANWLRQRRAGAAQVRPVELFFDLVYVLAITQITHYLLDTLTLRGAVEALLLLLAVWGGWINTVWLSNYLNLGAMPARLMLLGAMFVSLILSASLSEAFGERGLVFAVAFVLLLVGATAFLLIAVGRHNRLSRVPERVLISWSVIGIVWIAGGLAEGDVRLAIWIVAIVLSYLDIWLGFPVPGLGHSETTDYTILGSHFAERCQLFIILALGESILITGANFGEMPSSIETIAAFVVAFLGTVGLWWIYFDRGAEAGLEVMARAADPGRLGLSAFTYYHIPMVAGIILVAAADELTIAHPNAAVTAATAGVILGGPLLYLLGNMLYKNALWGHVPLSRYAGVVVLVILIPVSFFVSTLALLAAATVVVLAIAVWDTRAYRNVPEPETNTAEVQSG